MTFIAAVAAGDDAVASLARYCATRGAASALLARHADLAVAWAADCPWIHSDDDGSVLVLLDGALHNLPADEPNATQWLRRRYRQHGIQLARGLLGDFIVVVLDRATGLLLVARDPLGVRPWYFAGSGRKRVGASSVATLIAMPWVDTGLNENLAIEYLASVPLSRGETLHKGIHTLRPGQTWKYQDGEAETVEHHRWTLDWNLDLQWDEAAERCRTVLDEAVRCRLEPGVPAASDLSGGLDSSAVVGTVMKLGWTDLTVGRLMFDSPQADESRYSDAVINLWGLAQVEAPPWIPTEDEFAAMMKEFGRPPPDPNFTMFVTLHRTMLDGGRRTGLTGLGGDDAFTAVHVPSRIVSAVQLRQRAVVGKLLRTSLQHPRQGWSGMIKPVARHLAGRGGESLPEWVSARAAGQAGLGSLFRQRAARITGIDAFDERLGQMTTGYDAWALEDRALIGDWIGRRESHPYLDPRFVTATYGLDPWWPVRGGHDRALQVHAYRDRLPAVVADRRSKAEFSEVVWPQLLTQSALTAVRTGPLRELGWLDTDGFDAIAGAAERGRADAALPLSRCVSLDRWLRTQ